MHELLSRVGLAEAEVWSAFLQPALRILVILALAWAAFVLAGRLIRLMRTTMTAKIASREEAMRVDTLGRVLRYVVSVIIWAVASMLILSELGVSIAPILGAAGVAGIAVGFGAQSLVKDYFAGMIMLMENQVRVGDVVEAGGKSGLVEEVTLRYVRVRDYEGSVHFIPNGIITTVSNLSREYAFALIDVGIAYGSDINRALEIMRTVAAVMRADAAFGPRIVADIEVAGVERWDDSAVVLRARLKTLPLEQWNVRREYLRRLKYAFDAEQIEIPYPHVTVYAGTSAGRAPFPVELPKPGP